MMLYISSLVLISNLALVPFDHLPQIPSPTERHHEGNEKPMTRRENMQNMYLINCYLEYMKTCMKAE